MVQIRAYVGGHLCGLLLNPGSQYVISGTIPVLHFLLHVPHKQKKQTMKKDFQLDKRLTRFEMNSFLHI